MIAFFSVNVQKEEETKDMKSIKLIGKKLSAMASFIVYRTHTDKMCIIFSLKMSQITLSIYKRYSRLDVLIFL